MKVKPPGDSQVSASRGKGRKKAESAKAPPPPGTAADAFAAETELGKANETSVSLQPGKPTRAKKRAGARGAKAAPLNAAQSARLLHHVDLLENAIMGHGGIVVPGLTRKATAWLRSMPADTHLNFIDGMQALFAGLNQVEVKQLLDETHRVDPGRQAKQLRMLSDCLHPTIPVSVRRYLVEQLAAGQLSQTWLRDTQRLVGGVPLADEGFREAQATGYLQFLDTWKGRSDLQRHTLLRSCQSVVAGMTCSAIAEVVPTLLELSDEHRQELGIQARRLYRSSFDGSQRAAVSKALLAAPESELAACADAMLPLMNHTGATRTPDMLRSVVETPEPLRAAHVASLVQSLEAQDAVWQQNFRFLRMVDEEVSGRAPAVDRESAMRKQRLDAEAESVATLLARFPALPQTSDILQQADDWLRDPTSFSPSERQALDKQQRDDGQSRLDDALRVLFGTMRSGDFSESVSRTPTTADVFALVWHAIARYEPKVALQAQTERDQANMRAGLVFALSECIEEDGHRVCGDGTRQRLVNVLAGYFDEVQAVFVTPAEKLGALAQAFGETIAAQGHEATQAQVDNFEKTARAEGVASFNNDAGLLKEFNEQLRQFIEMTF